MGVELVVGMAVRWERKGDFFYLDEIGVDGSERTIAVPAQVLIEARPKIASAVAERALARMDYSVVPIHSGDLYGGKKGKRGRH